MITSLQEGMGIDSIKCYIIYDKLISSQFNPQRLRTEGACMKQFDYWSLAINIFGGKYTLVHLGMNALTQNLTYSSFW